MLSLPCGLTPTVRSDLPPGPPSKNRKIRFGPYQKSPDLARLDTHLSTSASETQTGSCPDQTSTSGSGALTRRMKSARGSFRRRQLCVLGGRGSTRPSGLRVLPHQQQEEEEEKSRRERRARTSSPEGGLCLRKTPENAASIQHKRNNQPPVRKSPTHQEIHSMFFRPSLMKN